MSEHSALSYKRKVLFGNDAFEIVSCEWTSESTSPLHNHGWSECLILVEEGLFENRAEFGLKSELRVIEPGQVIATPTGVEHEIRCLSKTGKTLHVYLPKIKAHNEAGKFSSLSLAQIRKSIDLALGESASDWVEVEGLLAQIRANSISTHSPFFMNQLFSGIFPETLAAEKIIAQTKTTMATFEASPVFTAVELEVIEKLGELIGWPAGQRDGIGMPGGSAANMMAVHCARQRRVPGFRKNGHQGERFRIFASQEAHYSLKKACLVTGLGTDALITVNIDDHGRMSLPDLQQKIEESLRRDEIPLLVCATSGTTVLGAFDPIEGISKICQEGNIWLHVDGAWGGPALFSKKTRHLVAGIEHADSMAFDAHKLFGANLTSSFFLTKERGILLEANDVAGGDYIFHTNEVTQDRGRLSWQCGRGPDALSFWTLWKNNGTHGLGRFVDRLYGVRDEVVQWIKTQPRLQLVGEPSYLNICVRVLPTDLMAKPTLAKDLREKMKEDDFALVNFSRNEDGDFLRLILAHPKIEFAHVKVILVRALDSV